MQCKNPYWLESQQIQVPCGRCRACRIRRSSEWTIRLEHEFHYFNNHGMFVTLTYDDYNVPADYGLRKQDLQNFFKRLRKRLEGRKIKYFACGEYGTKTARPHYHCIILGLDFCNDNDHNIIFKSWDRCEWSKIRKQKSIGFVSRNSIRYTCDYIQKKFFNGDEVSMWLHYGYREPEFQLQSKGIGERFCEAERKDIELTGKIKYHGKEIALPRYYTSKVEVPADVKVKNKNEAVAQVNRKFNIHPLDSCFFGIGSRLPTEDQEKFWIQHNANLEAFSRIKEKPLD